MSQEFALGFVLGLSLAAIHLFAGRVQLLRRVPRTGWLSAAGGASVAYVFVHIFPELSEAQEELESTGLLGALDHHIYLIALFGLAVFYGLERVVGRARPRRTAPPAHLAGAGVFWLHVGSFAVYNALIGYLLLGRGEEGQASMALFALAMGLHFFTNDRALRERHHEDYDRVGRWLLAAMVVLGTLLHVAFDVSEAVLAVLFAFLAGGVILNVLKEEVPEERESRLSAFALGAALYAALLLAA